MGFQHQAGEGEVCIVTGSDDDYKLFRPIRRQLKESRCTQVVIFASFLGASMDRRRNTGLYLETVTLSHN